MFACGVETEKVSFTKYLVYIHLTPVSSTNVLSASLTGCLRLNVMQFTMLDMHLVYRNRNSLIR